MNKIVLVVGDDRNQVTSLLQLMQGQNFSQQVYGDAIILNQKNCKSNNKQQVIYIPYINANDTEFFDIVYYLSKQCNLVSILFCLNYSTQVNQKIQNIDYKLQTYFKQKEIIQYIKFLIYDSPKFNNQEQQFRSVRYNLSITNNEQKLYFTNLGEILLQKYSYIFLKQQKISEQVQTYFSNQEIFDSYIQQYIQKYSQLNEKLFLQQLENNNIYSLFDFNSKSIKQIYSNFITITQFFQQNFYASCTRVSSCDTCRLIYIQDYQQTIILSLQDFKKKKLNQWNKRCSCGNYAFQMDSQKIYDLFKYQLLFEYQKYVLSGIINLEEQQTQLTKGILLLRNEAFGQMSIIQRVYTDMIEQEKEIVAGDNLDDLFYLISTPDFIFESDSDEKMDQFSNLFNFNQKEIYFIIFCLNYQRTDLMKKQLYEMLKLLNQVDRVQMGVFIIQTNSNQMIDQKLFEQLQCQIQNIDVIYENDSREQIIQKVKKMINQNFSQTLDFSKTIFNQQIDNQDTIQIQLNEQLEQLELQSIKELSQSIDKLKEEKEQQFENLQQLKVQMEQLQKEIETAEKKLSNSNKIISNNEKKLKELQQYQYKKKHPQTQNQFNKKKY